MAGPWEKYSASEPAPSAGPWTQYSGNTPPAAAQVARPASQPAVAEAPSQYTPEQQAFIDSINNGPAFEAPADVPLGKMIRDNLLGDDDDTTFNTGEKIGQMLNNAGEGLTFGIVGDEATAAASAALGGDYDATLSQQRGNQEQFRDQHPALSVASELAPAFIPGMGAAKALQGASMGRRALTGAGVGAAGGATIGFTEGEGGLEERATNAATTAALGGVFGAVAPKALDALGNLPGRVRNAFNRSAARPTVDALRATKNAAYEAVDQAGVSFTGDDMTALSGRVQQIFNDSNFDEVADTASGAVLRQLRGKEGRDTTLGQLDRVRQGLWKRHATASDQPQILDAISEIDDMIARHPDASGLMDAARAANSTFAKSQLLESAFDRASRNTSVSGSGGNIANNYMRAVNSVLNNKREMRFFNADEEKAMRAFVAMADEGGPRIRRLLGKMSPNGNGLMMTLHAVGGMASGGATLPLMVAGGAAKSSADRAVLRGGEALQDMFAGVTPAAQPQNALSQLGGGSVTAALPAIQNAQAGFRPAGSSNRLANR